jgi:N-formylmaleamate deformylase
LHEQHFLYGAHVHANGIRQHYLRYGGSEPGARATRDAVVILPGITSPAVTWGFVGERFGRTSTPTSSTCAAAA